MRHLPNVLEGHKRSCLHGHSFKIEIYVSGEVEETFGWIMDFADTKWAFQPLFERLDNILSLSTGQKQRFQQLTLLLSCT